MRAETGPIGGNLCHEFIILAADRRVARCSATRTISTWRCRGADVNFDDVAGLQAIVDKWTSQYAATSDMHDAAAFAKCRPTSRCRRAASRSATSSISAPNIPSR